MNFISFFDEFKSFIPPAITVEQAEGTKEGEFPISIGVKVPIEGKEQDFSYVLVSQESNQAFYIVHNSVFRMILTRKEEGNEFIYVSCGNKCIN